MLTTRRRERKRIAKRFLLLSIFIKPLVFFVVFSGCSLFSFFLPFWLSIPRCKKQINKQTTAREKERKRTCSPPRKFLKRNQHERENLLIDWLSRVLLTISINVSICALFSSFSLGSRAFAALFDDGIMPRHACLCLYPCSLSRCLSFSVSLMQPRHIFSASFSFFAGYSPLLRLLLLLLFILHRHFVEHRIEWKTVWHHCHRSIPTIHQPILIIIINTDHQHGIRVSHLHLIGTISRSRPDHPIAIHLQHITILLLISMGDRLNIRRAGKLKSVCHSNTFNCRRRSDVYLASFYCWSNSRENIWPDKQLGKDTPVLRWWW